MDQGSFKSGSCLVWHGGCSVLQPVTFLASDPPHRTGLVPSHELHSIHTCNDFKASWVVNNSKSTVVIYFINALEIKFAFTIKISDNLFHRAWQHGVRNFPNLPCNFFASIAIFSISILLYETRKSFHSHPRINACFWETVNKKLDTQAGESEKRAFITDPQSLSNFSNWWNRS